MNHSLWDELVESEPSDASDASDASDESSDGCISCDGSTFQRPMPLRQLPVPSDGCLSCDGSGVQVEVLSSDGTLESRRACPECVTQLVERVAKLERLLCPRYQICCREVKR